jgi:transcriptional regulator with XRE-family HTH domain
MKKSQLSLYIGKKIRSFREQQGFSQESFADHVGIDRANYGAIERGARHISIYILARIANGLSVEPAELLPSKKELQVLLK